MLAMTVGASAKSLVLQLADGTEVYYLLGGEMNPKMTLVNGEMTVNTDHFTFSQVTKFFISEEDDPATAIAQVGEQQTQMREGQLYVKTAEKVGVYRSDGKLVASGRKLENGGCMVDTDRLPAGVYVVRIGNKSMKFMKK